MIFLNNKMTIKIFYGNTNKLIIQFYYSIYLQIYNILTNIIIHISSRLYLHLKSQKISYTYIF